MREETRKFLETYKIFEKKLKELADEQSNDVSINRILEKAIKRSALVQLNEGKIRQLSSLRNIFSHADGDKYIADINEQANIDLNDLIKLLNNPPKVGDVFKKEVHTCQLNDITESVIRAMKVKLYTHIPVYDGSQFIGVFSETSIVEWLVDNIDEGRAQFYKRTISAINRKYLHTVSNLFKFVSSDHNIFDILRIFDEYLGENKRLGAILITTDGRKESKLVGIITAWDLPQIRSYLIK